MELKSYCLQYDFMQEVNPCKANCIKGLLIAYSPSESVMAIAFIHLVCLEVPRKLAEVLWNLLQGKYPARLHEGNGMGNTPQLLFQTGSAFTHLVAWRQLWGKCRSRSSVVMPCASLCPLPDVSCSPPFFDFLFPGLGPFTLHLMFVLQQHTQRCAVCMPSACQLC